jgi:hypothetical protein
MVERFSRRLGEHLDRRPQLRAHRHFRGHAERDTDLAPDELLANLAGHNIKAAGSASEMFAI